MNIYYQFHFLDYPICFLADWDFQMTFYVEDAVTRKNEELQMMENPNLFKWEHIINMKGKMGDIFKFVVKNDEKGPMGFYALFRVDNQIQFTTNNETGWGAPYYHIINSRIEWIEDQMMSMFGDELENKRKLHYKHFFNLFFQMRRQIKGSL